MPKEILTRLLEITVYSAVLMLAVLLVRLLLRRWLSPALKYALWFIVLLRLLVPVTLESGFHLFRLPESQLAAVTTQQQTPMAQDQPAEATPAH